MDVEYFNDVKEHIKGMNEEEFTKRRTIKKAALNALLDASLSVLMCM